ncbi:MAG: bifunctional phosphoglucose/phosphomannose isomerase [Thermoleophilaceae bacterium]
MRDDVLGQPHQIADALWRVEAAKVPQREAPRGLMVCGMGGSAMGADLAAAAIGPRALAPLRTVRGYAPDPWVGPDTLVLCASYSGWTEEALSCYEAAGAAGAPRVAITTGGPLAERAREEGVPVIGVPSGMQPRAAVIYMTVAALECAAACRAAPSLRTELEGATGTLTALAGDAGEARTIAVALHQRMPVVHGTELTAAPARRWKKPINANVKSAAFASELPEANHNEIEGWEWAAAHASPAAVLLSAPESLPRIERRIELTAELIERAGAPVVRVAARGETPVDHVLSLVMLGDLVSIEMAELAGVDATPVETIEGFKRRLD